MKPPIFVIGSGRSGTTLLYDLLTGHENLAWASNLSNRVPRLPILASASRSKGLRSMHRAFAPAMETIEGYAHIGLDNSTIPWVDNSNIDISDLSKRVHNYFEAHCKAWNRDQFVTKNTSNSMRISLLERMFPDALYVHIHRHPYSVISSLLKIGFWPDLNLWWSDQTPRQLEKAGAHPIAIAAEHWNRQVQAILESAESLPSSRFFQVSYEDLVHSPESECRQILAFLGLELSDTFKHNIKSQRVSTSSIDKWKQAAEKDQYALANPIVSDLASHLNYELI